MTARDRAFDAWVAAARSTRIVDELRRRGADARLKRSGGELVGPCPRCGGHDRFAVNLAKNLWNCRGCGTGGDAIALVETIGGAAFLTACEILTGEKPPGQVDGESAAERAARLERLAAEAEARAAEAARTAAKDASYRTREIQACRGLWNRAGPLKGSAAERYLRHRGLIAPAGARLRCAPALPLWNGPPPDGTIVHQGPAMVGGITGPDGRFSGVHLTWIDLAQPNGKAIVADARTGEFVPARKVRGTKTGGSILLGPAPNGAPSLLVLGEGIETVLSVWAALVAAEAQILAVAEWRAGIDLGNLAGRARRQVPHPTLTVTDSRGRVRRKAIGGPEPAADDAPVIPIPATVTDLLLLGDGDSEAVETRHKLERAGARFASAYPWLTVRLAMAAEGFDFNDLWRMREAAE